MGVQRSAAFKSTFLLACPSAAFELQQTCNSTMHARGVPMEV
jgi:hypothetical protein